MRMHQSIIPSLAVLSICVPMLGASQNREPSADKPFWLTAPDNRPGAFLKSNPWRAKDALSRATVSEPGATGGPRSSKPPWLRPAQDPFTAAFFSGQEPDGKDQHPHDMPLLPDDPIDLPAQRPVQQPSVFASPAVGIAFFAVGIAGWIALGVSAFLLDRKRANQPSRSS